MAEPTAWRVLTVEEEEGFFKITAVSYRSDKYCYIERGDPLETQVLPDFTTPPDPPASVTAQEIQYDLNGTVSTKIYLSWPSVTGVNTYKVKWRLTSGIWTEATAFGPSYDILNVTTGTYEIEVYSISPLGIVSTSAATTTIAVAGTGAAPAAATSLSVSATTETTATVSWDASSDLDVKVGGQVFIRHDPRTVPDATWEKASPIASVAGSSTSAIVPLLTGTYFVKFKDQGGSKSVVAASIYATLPSPQPKLTVKTWAEENNATPFNGTKTNVSYNAGRGGLFLNSALNSIGEYIYKNMLDLGAVYGLNLKRAAIVRPEVLSGTPAATDTSELKTYYRSTNDDPFGTTGVVWSSWAEYVNTVVQCRAVQLKAVMTAPDSQVGMVVTNLGAVAELQQRTETGEAQGSYAYAIVYNHPFYQTPGVVITASGMVSGDYYTISDASRTGFSVEFRNSSNIQVERNFTYTATGYGLQLSSEPGPPPPADANFPNVALLLPMDGGNNSTVFTDKGPNELTVSVTGAVEISTAQSKFGGASALFDVSASAQYLSVAASALFDFGASIPFTVELFFRASQLQSGGGIISQRITNTFAPFELICSNTSVGWYIGNGALTAWQDTSVSASGTAPITTWHHLALVGDGVNLKLYLNGSERLSTSQPSWASVDREIFIGAGWSDRLVGNIDDVRVTKSVARYLSNFIPPAEPFPLM